MKNFSIIILRFIALILLLTVLLFYAANPLIKRYENDIRANIRDKISKDINFQDLKLSGFPLPSVVVKGFSYKKGVNFALNIPKITLYINPANLFWNNSHLVWAARVLQPKLEVVTLAKNEFVYEKDSYQEDTIEYIFSLIPRFSTYSIGNSDQLLESFFSADLELSNLDISDGQILIWDQNANTKRIENIDLHGKVELTPSVFEFKKNHFSAIYRSTENNEINFGGDSNIKLIKLGHENINLIISGNSFFKKGKKEFVQIFSPYQIEASFQQDGSFVYPLYASLNFSSNGSLKIKKASLNIIPFKSKNNLSLLVDINGEIADGNFTSSAICEIRNDYRIWNVKLNSDLFSLLIDQLELVEEEVFKFANVQLNLAEENLSLSGTLNTNLIDYKVSASSTNIDLSNLSKIAKIELPSLVFAGEMNVTGSSDQKVVFSSKSFKIKKYFSKDGLFSVKEGSLKDFLLTLKNNQPLNLTSSIDLTKIKVKYPSTDLYAANRIVGNLNINKSKKYKFSAGLKLESFSYKEPNVTLTNIPLQIENLQGSYSKKSGFIADAKISASNLKLDSKQFKITSLETINGPLKVLVDSNGKYLVQSNTVARNVIMEIFNKNITASGGVNFSLTNLNKSFIAQEISGLINTKPFSLLETNFEILEENYEIKHSTLAAFNGKTIISGTSSRNSSAFQLDLDAQDISLSEFAYLLQENRRENINGNLKKLKLNLSGNKGETSSITGQGELVFEKGKLKKLELDEILGSPVQGPSKDEGTYVEKLDLKAVIDQGVVRAEDFALAGRFYTFKGQGTYSYDNGFKVKGYAVYLEKTLSELGGPIKILRKLLGSLVKIQIPVKIKGPAEDPVVEADLNRVMSIISPGRAVQSIGEGVGDIFGGIKDVVTGK